MKKKIPELLDFDDEIVVTDEIRNLFDPEEIKEMTMNKIHQNEPQASRVRKPAMVILAAAAAAALTMTANIVALVALAEPLGLSTRETSTKAVIMTGMTGFIMLFKVSAPFNTLRGLLFSGLLSAFLLAFLFFGWFFALESMTLPMLIALMPLLLFAIVFMLAALHLVDHVIANSQSPVYPVKVRQQMRRGKGKEKAKGRHGAK